jgi:small subunit ribosomal protein S20
LEGHISVEKRARQSEKARLRNRNWKSKIKTSKGKLEIAIENKEIEALSSLYNDYVSVIDRAASRKVLHKNNASRKKARMARKINSLKDVT